MTNTNMATTEDTTKNTTKNTTKTKPAHSLWFYLLAIIDRPQKAFSDLVARSGRPWWLPLILALIMGSAAVWLVAPMSSELAEAATQQQINQSGMPPEQAEEVLAASAQFRSPLFIGLIGNVSALIIIPLAWVIGTTFFYFIALMAGADKLRFGQVFTVLAWANLPLVLQGLILSILPWVTGEFPVYPGLATFQVSGNAIADSTNPLIPLLGQVDIFRAWHLFLLIVGLAVVTRFSRFKSFFIVLIYFILGAALAAAPAFISGLFQSNL